MIRRACPLDALNLIKMGKQYSGEALNHDAFKADTDYAMQQALTAISDPNSCVLVAIRGTELVGFIYAVHSTFTWSRVPIAIDQLLYVTPEHRGGTYGFSLIKGYERWAVGRGIPEIRLSVASGITEERTCKLYKALGYSPGGFMYRKEL